MVSSRSPGCSTAINLCKVPLTNYNNYSKLKVLVWDATCPDTLAPSYANLAAREAGAVADEAERKKKAKYAHLESSHHFVPVAVETLGVLGSEARTLLRDLGRRLKDSTMEPLSHHYIPPAKDQRGGAARQYRCYPRFPCL